LSLLFGAMVFEFSSLGSGKAVDEAVERFETLVRFARSESSGTGRRVRLRITPELVAVEPGVSGGEREGPVTVSIERDPLGAPDEFTPLGSALWARLDLEELVRLEAVKKINGAPTIAETEPSPGAAVEVTFYPDGSADPFEVVFASREEDETERRAGVRVIGITGRLERFEPLAPGAPDAGEDASEVPGLSAGGEQGAESAASGLDALERVTSSTRDETSSAGDQ
ncbi:MAG TPA: GspH/FimT family pseudopilin, partial [Planctomycetota bacterium]|nr:GspH/FimT family pseudopilin [Planctomycetota bacterium]